MKKKRSSAEDGDLRRPVTVQIGWSGRPHLRLELKEGIGEDGGDIWVGGRGACRQREQPAQRFCRRNVSGLFQSSNVAQGIWIRENSSKLDGHPHIQLQEAYNRAWHLPPSTLLPCIPFINVKVFQDRNFEVIYIPFQCHFYVLFLSVFGFILFFPFLLS